MIGMFNYIFNNLENSSNDIINIKNQLKKQTTFNKRLIMFSAVISTYAIITRLKVDKLHDDIEEIKQKKGE